MVPASSRGTWLPKHRYVWGFFPRKWKWYIEFQGLPSCLLGLGILKTPNNLSKIVTEAFRSPVSGILSSSCTIFACVIQNAWQSYRTRLRTAELVDETRHLLPPCVGLLSILSKCQNQCLATRILDSGLQEPRSLRVLPMLSPASFLCALSFSPYLFLMYSKYEVLGFKEYREIDSQENTISLGFHVPIQHKSESVMYKNKKT